MKIQQSSVFNSNPTNSPVNNLKVSSKTRDVAEKLQKQLAVQFRNENNINPNNSIQSIDIIV